MAGGTGSAEGGNDSESYRFDEFFVRSAAYTEPSAEQRIARAQQAWARSHYSTPQPPARRQHSGPLRSQRMGTALVVLVAVVGILTFRERVSDVLGGPGSAGSRSGSDYFATLHAGSRGFSAPPLPADASDQPLGIPAPAPAGAGGFQFMSVQSKSGRPVAFDPCRPLHYVVRPDGEITGGRAEIVAAIAAVSKATGLVFVDDGQTDEVPSDDRAPVQVDRYGDRWAPILIAWSNDVETPRLAGHVVGLGGPQMYGSDRDGSLRFVTGSIWLDAPDLGAIKWQLSTGYIRTVVMHELGHVVGLDHVDDPAQLMYPDGTGLIQFGAGDLRGLHELGLGSCHKDG